LEICLSELFSFPLRFSRNSVRCSPMVVRFRSPHFLSRFFYSPLFRFSLFSFSGLVGVSICIIRRHPPRDRLSFPNFPPPVLCTVHAFRSIRVVGVIASSDFSMLGHLLCSHPPFFFDVWLVLYLFPVFFFWGQCFFVSPFWMSPYVGCPIPRFFAVSFGLALFFFVRPNSLLSCR